MRFELIRANIVVLAKNHNPSIVSKEWLAQNKIIEEQIISFTHLPVLSVIDTDNFKLVVDEDRLQLSIKKISPDNLKALPQIILKHINQLPETPYKAIGFNYFYRVGIGQENLKDVLLINDKRLMEIFSENYAFGGIIKFQFMDFMVTLTSHPTSNREITGEFNFHFEANNRDEIIKKLYEYPDTKKRAEEILGGLFYA